MIETFLKLVYGNPCASDANESAMYINTALPDDSNKLAASENPNNSSSS